MPITDTENWERCKATNQDPYGGTCIKVAQRVMEILDQEEGDFDCHELICRADDETKAGGITGFMAGCVANAVSSFHSRGDEFRRRWNKGYGVDDDKKGVVNPAILTINE